MIGQTRKRAFLGAMIIAALTPGCTILPRIAPKMEQQITLPEGATPSSPSGQTPALVERRAPLETSSTEDRLIYYNQIAGSLASAAAGNPELEGKTITLSFAKAPAADVARAVIGDVLGQTVAVANGVSGEITLSSEKPIPALEALNDLEAVLAESGLALLKTKDGFLLTTIKAASQESARVNGRSSAIGYGVKFAPVQYANPSELVTLIKPFVSDRLTLSPDDARGIIVLRGPESDIASAEEAIETFDTPHLVDRTYGMFHLQYADATTMRSELTSLLDASRAGGAAAAELLALPRLNYLFVTTRTKTAFAEVRGWVDRLDKPSGGDQRRLHYYPVQNTSAEALQSQLNAAFGNGGGGQFDSYDSNDAGSYQGSTGG
ncbi:MAG TPA: secretin N-terminal domain-containing protein, partial [Parvularculaceae bacterium]|nr:secretin N-terminal domain-containing protein [Parvularculaceae bacterium]